MASSAADEVVRIGVEVTGASAAVTQIADMEAEIAGAADRARELQAQLKIMQSQKSVDIEQFRAVSGALDEQKAKLAEAQAAYQELGGSAQRAAAVARGGLGSIEATAEKAAAAAERAAQREAAAAEKAAAAQVATAEKAAAAAERAAQREAAAAEKAAAREQRAADAAAKAKIRDAERAADAAERAADRQTAANARGLNSLKQFSTAAGGRFGAIVGTALEINEHFGNLSPRLKTAAVAIGAIGVAMAAVAVTTKVAAAAFRGFYSLLEFVVESADKTGALAAVVADIKTNAKGLFADTYIGDFVKALRDATASLSATTSTGRALRALLSGMMTEFFQGAAKALPYVKEGLIGVAIVALSIYIPLKKAANALEDMLAPIGGLSGMETALLAGKIAGYALLVVVVAIAAAVSLLLLPWVILGVAIWAAYSAAVALWNAVKAGWETVKSAVMGAVDSVLDFVASVAGAFASIDLGQVASDMVDGLIAGITGSIGAVVGAVTDLANSAVSAMRSVLDSHSPSEVFKDIGRGGIGGGLVVGMEEAEGEVEEGVEALVDPKAIKAEAKGGAGRGGGNRIVYIESMNVADGKDFLVQLAAAFEMVSLEATPAGPVTP